MVLSSVRLAAVAAALAASSALSGQCGIDQNFGTVLPLTDDSVSLQQVLGFAFPFAGANYDAIYVSSNGFVYLFDTTGTVPPPAGSQCCNGNVAGLLASASPMVAGMWFDLNPSAGGSVYFNALPGRALISWVNVPEFGNAGSQNTFQIVLRSSGVIEFIYDTNINSITHTALVGWSPGNGATDPGASNLSARPILASSATVYELFGPNSFDMASTSLQGNPTGPSSWIVDTPIGCAATSVYGRGCPRACDFYEVFPNSTFDLSGGSLLLTATGSGSYNVTTCATNCFDMGFTNNLMLGDDQLASAMPLGFTFPYCGGSTTAIDVCSNGFVWLQTGGPNSDWTPSLNELLAQPARLCPLWMDLNPAAAGGVYFDALPGKALITWNQVPAFGATGSSNTIQMQLFPNGNIILAWPAANNNASTGGGAAITAFTQGNGIGDPGQTDVSAVPYTTGSGIPLRFTAQASSRPVIGTTVVLEATQVRAGTAAAALILGASNPNIDLTLFGLPGCTLLSTLDVNLSVPVSLPITTVSLAIPNLNSLVGRSLNTQMLMIDISLTPIPAYLSNGLLLTLGR
jgi:hypothetical protein